MTAEPAASEAMPPGFGTSMVTYRTTMPPDRASSTALTLETVPETVSSPPFTVTDAASPTEMPAASAELKGTRSSMVPLSRMVPSCWPAWTSSPTSTSRETTVPDLDAVTLRFSMFSTARS